MGIPIRKEACEECRKIGQDRTGDNKVIYDDSSGWCFKCNTHFEPCKNTLNATKLKKNNLDFVYGSYQALKDRNIDIDTCKFFNYQVRQVNGRSQHIANYHNQLGKLTKQKIRKDDKKFFNLGETRYLGFFGKNLWKPSDKLYVTITEGEIDAMSICQIFGCKFPVVSLPDGAGSITKAIAYNREWLLSFKYIVLALDNDNEGLNATEKAINELYEKRVHVVNWPDGIKDANDLLKKGRVLELKECVYNAAPIVSESVVDLGSVIKESLEPLPIGHSWGWKGLDTSTYGLRKGELILIGAGSSVGKTTFLNQIGLKLAFDESEKIGIISFEKNYKETSRRLAGLVMNKRIWLPGAKYDKEEAIAAGKSLIGKAYAIDTSKDLNTVEKVINKIIYLVKVIGIAYIFIDHITCIASMIPGDERRGLDSIMFKLSSITRDLNCTLIVVSHLAKPVLYESKNSDTSKTFEQGRRVLATDFRGSQALQYYATLIIGLSRNISKPNSPMIVEILKNGIDGDSVGRIIELGFCRDTGKLEEIGEII